MIWAEKVDGKGKQSTPTSSYVYPTVQSRVMVGPVAEELSWSIRIIISITQDATVRLFGPAIQNLNGKLSSSVNRKAEASCVPI
ncbi:hypothetical protein MJO28_010997 [Puccinia striiformis f. sp. tritici]|uniref:Uncharacterized protein n=1 Tax=Puccinia striiformis f. sp. tritici TaxID=168172 RepID=A0ACC0E0V5_9BASI|nr:hypothetical protein MJO28_010997 [Puccinia striiformis f. sp. tritici]